MLLPNELFSPIFLPYMYEIIENEIANQTQLYINNQFISISSRLEGEIKFQVEIVF